jgi:hypothetical protein
MMQHYDRTKITEEPIPRCAQCQLKPCEICCHPVTIAPVICAESIQAEQRGERFSLRRMK